MNKVAVTGILFVMLMTSCDLHYGELGEMLNMKKDSVLKNMNGKACFDCEICDQKDTITPMGTKIHYNRVNEKFQISWSNDSYQRKYDSIFTCIDVRGNGLWDFVPKLKNETKNYLVFTNISWTSSGGNPAPLEYGAFVFPKNKFDTIYKKDLFIDTKDNYLVYGDWFCNEIFLLNLETKRTQEIVLKPKLWLSRSPTLAIKETNILKNIFYIKYEYLDKNDDIRMAARKFKIEI